MRGVDLLTMEESAPILPDQTIIIQEGLIRWIGPTTECPEVQGATVMSAEGLLAIPGLIDAHVHLFDESQLALFPVNGVTTVFNLSGAPFVRELQKRIDSGALFGPRVYTTGPQIKEQATPPVDTEVTYDAVHQAERLVRMHIEQGYPFLKVWSSILPPLYEALAAECRKHDLRMTGHVPAEVGLRGVLSAGQDSIAHVEELVNKYFLRNLDEEAIPTVVSIAKDLPFTLITTIITYEMIADSVDDERFAARLSRRENRYIDPLLLYLWGSEDNDWRKLRNTSRGRDGYYDRARGFMLALTGKLHAAGVILLAGTDSGLVIANVLPGFSLHRELEILVEAGLTEREALAAATSAPGQFLAPGSGLGTLAVGAPADVLLLRANPLESISNTRSIEAVIAHGVLHTRAELDQTLSGIERSHEAARAFRADLETLGALEAVKRARAGLVPGQSRRPSASGLLIGAYHLGSAGRVDEALTLAELAMDLYSDRYSPALFAAGLHTLAGRNDEARVLLERARDLCPDHPLIPWRLERLGE